MSRKAQAQAGHALSVNPRSLRVPTDPPYHPRRSEVFREATTEMERVTLVSSDLRSVLVACRGEFVSMAARGDGRQCISN